MNYVEMLPDPLYKVFFVYQLLEPSYMAHHQDEFNIINKLLLHTMIPDGYCSDPFFPAGKSKYPNDTYTTELW